jgi:UDP-glucose 4-epimerase
MKHFVTGGAGFIGSHLVDRLIDRGEEVAVYDNLSSGKKKNIEHHFANSNFGFIQRDILDLEKMTSEMKDSDFVWHIAASADIKKGMENIDLDFNNNILGTHNVLKAMASNKIKKIVFASSSTVYGQASKIPTPEDYGSLLPISLYGASKLM